MLIKFISIPDGLENYIKQNMDVSVIVLTMLGIYILEYQFKDKKDEWDMISSKAKKWIRKQNIEDGRRKEIEKKTKDYA